MSEEQFYPLEFPMAWKAKGPARIEVKQVWVWRKAYQKVAVDAELLAIASWLHANPRKQSKTITGLLRRING